MVTAKYAKAMLLVALAALFTANALAANESSGKPAEAVTSMPEGKTDLNTPPTTETPTGDNNTTVPTTPTTSTSTTTTTPETTTKNDTTTSTTPSTTTSTTSTTTTSTTPSTTTSSTAAPTTPTPAPNTTSTSTETPTTPAPTPVPHCKRFDAYSFVGGMILAYGSLAISLVLYKFYKTHWNSPGAGNNANNYRTL
uniref:Mucin n=1 Tax=Anopheles farauti TaxID=69004 RepID=A0A182Q8C9_9DIPT